MNKPLGSRGKRVDQKRNPRKRCLTALAVFIFTAVGAAMYIFWPFDIQPVEIIEGSIFPGTGSALTGPLPGMTEAEIREQMQKEADKGLFSFKINSQPVFNDGSDEGTLLIENPNHNIYPFVVDILLNETGENVYNSGGILPNHHIRTAKLTKTLPKGNHTATAYINVYDPKTNEYRGKSAVELTLMIKN